MPRFPKRRRGRPRKSLNMKLRKLREEKGMTQLELAVLSGLSPATVRNVELGTTIPTEATALAMLKTLELAPDQLPVVFPKWR